MLKITLDCLGKAFYVFLKITSSWCHACLHRAKLSTSCSQIQMLTSKESSIGFLPSACNCASCLVFIALNLTDIHRITARKAHISQVEKPSLKKHRRLGSGRIQTQVTNSIALDSSRCHAASRFHSALCFPSSCSSGILDKLGPSQNLPMSKLDC